MCKLFIHVTCHSFIWRAAELEKRIAELTSSSELVTRRLGRAERALRDINLDADDGNAPVRRPRSPVIDAALSDDEEADVYRRGHRHHTHTLRVCTLSQPSALSVSGLMDN